MIEHFASECLFTYLQHLSPEVLIAGEILLHKVSKFVDCEAVVVVFEAASAACHVVCISG